MKKALAIFLSVLMALSMCSMLGAVAFAVDAPEGYEILPTSADDLDPGDWYFDLDAYVAQLIELGRDADAERYQTTEYFIKEDHSAIKIFVQAKYDAGWPDPFENYDSDTSIFESYVKQVALDWIELRQNTQSRFDKTEQNLIEAEPFEPFFQVWDFRGVRDYRNDPLEDYWDANSMFDGQIFVDAAKEHLRFVPNNGDDEIVFENNSGNYRYFEFVFTEPFQWRELPTTGDGVSLQGALWFDLAEYIRCTQISGEADDPSYEVNPAFERARVYINSDQNVIKFDIPYEDECNPASDLYFFRSDGPVWVAYLKDGALDAPGAWSEVPTSKENLADGALWFDLAHWKKVMPASPLLDTVTSVEVNGNRTKLKINFARGDYAVFPRYPIAVDYTEADTGWPFTYTYLWQIGAHGEQLPFSPDGLSDGQYWLDTARLFHGVQGISIDEAYFDADNDTLVLILSTGAYDYHGEPAFIKHVHRVGQYDTWTALPTSADGLAVGAKWFAGDVFANALTEDPEDPEAFVAAYLSPDGQTLAVFTTNYYFEEASNSSFAYYLRTVEDYGDELPLTDEGLEKGDYWFDVGHFAPSSFLFGEDVDPETAELKVFLSRDRTRVRVFVNGVQKFNQSITDPDDDSGKVLYPYIRQVGEFDEGWTELPLSADLVEVGETYFDASYFLARFGNSAEAVYLSEDGSQLVIIGDQGILKGDPADGEEQVSLYAEFCLKTKADTSAPDGYFEFATDRAALVEGDMFFDWYAFAAAQADPGATEEEILADIDMYKNMMDFFYGYNDNYDLVILQRYRMGSNEMIQILDPVLVTFFEGETPVAEDDYDPDLLGLSYEEYVANYVDMKPDMEGFAEYYEMTLSCIDYVAPTPAEGFDEGEAPVAVVGANDFELPAELPAGVPADVAADELEPVFNAAPVEEEALAESVGPLEEISLTYTDENEEEQTVQLAGKKLAALDLSFDLFYNVYDEETYEIIDSIKAAENVQPAENKAILVKVPIPEAFNPNATRVFYIAPTGETEEIPSTVVGDMIHFELRHCSIYALVDLSENETPIDDPYPGYYLLPTADSDELEVGDYWFDLDSFIENNRAAGATEEAIALYQSMTLYLSEDGDTLKIVTPTFSFNAGRNTTTGSAYFPYLKQHEAAPACAHENMQATPANAATCTAEGNTAYWYCPDCEKYFSDANGETEIEADSWVLAIDPDNHTPAEAVKENDNPSTCNTLGSYESVVYCEVCNAELSRETVDYTEFAAHTPAEAVKENDNPSTCNTLGSYESVVYCEVCNAELSRETVDYTEYAAHTPGEPQPENDVASTCNTLGGYDTVVRCTVCGAVISSAHTDYTVYAAHQFGDWIDEQPASCEAAGVKGHKVCTVCGKNFDAEGVEIEDLAIAKLPHTPGDPVGAVAATCSATGYTGDIKCTVCGDVITEGTVIEKTAHTFGDWSVTKEASCKEEGTKSRTCSVCGETETEKIEKTPHSFADGVCTVCGAKQSDAKTCKWCGETHTGFKGFFIGFWHSFIYFWAHLFGKR
ncbi:MAG: hypothetical protein IJU56_09520 [Clostridia bacterium]|nr:hypothetical protein [Clostridia bacterium]